MGTPRQVVRFILRSGKRVGVAVAGGALVLVGLVMMVTPGPGIVFIILGLAVLATEFAWAAAVLDKAKEKASQAKAKVTRRKK